MAIDSGTSLSPPTRAAECILHVGMHKTGSSSIQTSLQGLRDSRFVYADLDITPNHSAAVQAIFADSLQRHLRSRADVERVRRRFDEEIAATGSRALIVSGENISGLDAAALSRLRDALSPHFARIRVVAYVRPPGAFMTSRFQEIVKRSLPPLDAAAHYPPFHARFARFDDHFGRENVALWKFDPAAFPRGCVVRDFCARLGIDLPEEHIRRVNESLSRAAVALLYVYRAHAETLAFPALLPDEAHRLGEALAALGRDRFRLSPELVRPVLDANAADIGWMEERLGCSLAEDLGPPRSDDIRSEADLVAEALRCAPGLLRLLGRSAPPPAAIDTVAVARLVEDFRIRMREDARRRAGWKSRLRRLGSRLLRKLA